VIRVPVVDLHVFGGDPQLAGDDLGEGGLVPLPLALHPDLETALPVGWKRSSALSNISRPAMWHFFFGPAPTISVKGRDADAHDPALLAGLFLLLEQRR
jgi:hypothetical protein